MTVRSDNVLVRMDRRGKREDRLTEVFVHLLNHLKQSHRQVASAVLTVLAPGTPGLSPDDMPSIKVDTQRPIDYRGMKQRKGRRPDITVQSPSTLIYVEVKRHSKPEPVQIEEYLKHLHLQRGVPHRRAVLLTIHMPGQDWPEDELLLQPVRWTQIAEILKSHREAITDPVTGVRVDDFLEFLQEDGMVLERVTKDLVTGAESMMHLMTLIQDVIDRSTRVIRDRNSGFHGAPTWLGYDFSVRIGRTQTRSCFVGVYFAQPSEVAFEFYEDKASAALRRWWSEQGFEESTRYDDPDWQTKLWDLVGDGFFDLNLEGQRRYIEQIVNSGIYVACQRTVPTNAD